ncbi:MAG TPA: hypothetical protein VII06_19485 [Chloroflexota bacterium]
MLLYQIICLQNTPPVDLAEQDRCMKSRTRCWRLARTKAKATSGDPEPDAAPAAEPVR